MIYFGMVDIGGAIIMFGITYFVGSYYSEGSDQLTSGKKLVQSVPLVTYMIMFGLNMSHIHIYMAQLLISFSIIKSEYAFIHDIIRCNA